MVASFVYGPHLEDLARQWCGAHASVQTVGGTAGRVQPATLACRACKTGHELDVVVTEERPFAADRITAIGKVKATAKRVDVKAVERLEHIRALLPQDKVQDVVKLLLFSRNGFTDGLKSLANQRTDVELVDLARLYHGE